MFIIIWMDKENVLHLHANHLNFYSHGEKWHHDIFKKIDAPEKHRVNQNKLDSERQISGFPHMEPRFKSICMHICRYIFVYMCGEVMKLAKDS